MKYALNVPINPVSFGQVSTCLLREIFYRSIFGSEDDVSLFPIGPVNLDSQSLEEDFSAWLNDKVQNNLVTHSRKNPTLKLWHLHGGFESLSEKQVLYSFYELDSPTSFEKTVVQDSRAVFSSRYTASIFKDHGVDVGYVPLGFDKYNFKKLNKTYFSDDRIVFNVLGKLEKRKSHDKIIKYWIKRFGNDKRYFLQCAIHNQFMRPEQNKQAQTALTEGKSYFNVQFLDYVPSNAAYNDLLNSGDIVLGLSGGEGWGLPEFQSVALGKHAVILNAHAYKDWATPENSVLVESSGKTEVYDGMFFRQGMPFNQGNIFTFDEDAFVAGCEKAIERVEKNRENEEGLKLQEEFTYAKTLDGLLEELKKIN
jgi:glycosyltransferase involved in cell wall biosynthesis